jgi:hypothetical protein
MDDWYTWGFSGIGAVAVGWIANYLLRNKNESANKARVEGSNTIQNSNNSNININK